MCVSVFVLSSFSCHPGQVSRSRLYLDMVVTIHQYDITASLALDHLVKVVLVRPLWCKALSPDLTSSSEESSVPPILKDWQLCSCLMGGIDYLKLL